MSKSSYSSVERAIARLLSATPILKTAVKSTYQYMSWIMNRSGIRYSAVVPVVSLGNRGESFFGYYDKSPVNETETHCLFHESDAPTWNKPDPTAPIKVVLAEVESGKELLRLETSAYNWQQGARLQWLTDDLFAFNDFDKKSGSYISRVYSRTSLTQVAQFGRPIQDSFGTDFLLSLSYRRLLALQADYGYRNLPTLSPRELADLEADGIWRVEYETGKSRLIYSLKDVVSVDHRTEFGAAAHAVNHILVSPNGGSFIFIHRYYLGKRRKDRLICADTEGGGLRVLADNEMVSHCSWVNDSTVFGYLRGNDGADGYWYIDIVSGEQTRFGNPVLEQYGDGHPHLVKDCLVTDSYPDKARMQHLLLANIKTAAVTELGTFFHGFRFRGETRCDLHPRLSPTGRFAYFDSVFSGKRKFYQMEVPQVKQHDKGAESCVTVP